MTLHFVIYDRYELISKKMSCAIQGYEGINFVWGYIEKTNFERSAVIVVGYK